MIIMNNNLPQDDIDTIIDVLINQYNNTDPEEVVSKKQAIKNTIQYLEKIKQAILNTDYYISVSKKDGTPYYIGNFHTKMHELDELNIITINNGTLSDIAELQIAINEALKANYHKPYLILPFDINNLTLIKKENDE